MGTRRIDGIPRKLNWLRGHEPGDQGPHLGAVSPRIVRAARLEPIIDLEPWSPPVRDQRDEGACASFMGCFLMSYLGMIDPAEQFLYYMARVYISLEPPNEDTGLTIQSVKDALEEYGVCEEKLWPYGDNPLDTMGIEPSEEAKKDAKQHCAQLCIWCPTVEEIDASLMQGVPVGFGMSLPAAFETERVLRGGELPFDLEGGYIGGHAMTIIGKDDDKTIDGDAGCYKVRNQWGKDFGQNGNVWIPKRYWREGIAGRNLSIHRMSQLPWAR